MCRDNNKMGGLVAVLACVAVATSASNALAVPYASGISESGSTVTYVLNEDADTITVKRTGDTDLVLAGNDLLKGTHTFDMGSASAYSIEVSKSSTVGWTQTSDDAVVESQYYSPRGVAINKNPSSPHFGNIYVSEGAGGTVTAPPSPNRDTLDGLFWMSADQTNLFTSFPNDGRIGGLVHTEDSTNSPFKITIAPDDSVYIADWADGSGGVYRAPPDLDESSDWPNVLANDNRDPNAGGLTDNHGSIPAVWVEGTGASTVLYTMDEDWPDASGIDAAGRGDIHRYDIGTATNYSAQPIVQVDDATASDGTPDPAGVILNGLMDFVRDEDGTWWTAQFRSDDTQTVPSLAHWADGATEPLWTSGKAAREQGDFDFDTDVDGDDFLTWQRNNGISDGSATAFQGDANDDGNVDVADLGIWEGNFGNVTPAGLVLDGVYGDLDIDNERDLIATGTRFGQGVYIVDISDPDNPSLVDTLPQSGRTRDVAFDIAGNLYVVSSSTETLKIWSPGGNFVATTGSDGSFVLASPPGIGAVPEPSSLLIVAMGVVCLVGRRGKRDRNQGMV